VDGASLVLELLAAGVALLGGYLAGSMPLAAWIARAAGMDPPAGRQAGRAGAASVWRGAGPGWGLLAVAGDLARGLLPVALAGVTWWWWASWAAAVGAVAGDRRPLRGKRRSGFDPVVLAGASIALSPLAGAMALVLALVAAGAARVLGGRARFAAAAAGLGSFAVLAVLEQGDAARVAAILVLDLVALVPLPPRRR
jgi:glycerol-3-phosphate acyltransferase PlsY